MNLPSILRLGALALALHLLGLWVLHGLNPGFHLSPDSPLYMRLAQGLAAGDGFASPSRTPGYPLYLAAFARLLGPTAWPLAAVASQQLLVLLSAFLAACTARRLFPDRPEVATIAFGFVALEPALWVHSYLILTESLFTVLVAGIALLAVRVTQVPRPAPVLALFALVCAAAYVRPIALYLPWLLGAALAALLLRVRPGLAAVCVLAAALASYGLQLRVERNLRRFDVPAFTTLSSNLVYEWFGSSVLARVEGRDWNEVRAELAAPLAAMTPGEQVRFAQREGSAIVLAHPVVAVGVALRGLVTNLLDPGTELLANVAGLRTTDSGLVARYHSTTPASFARYLLRRELPLVVLLAAGGLWMLVQYTALARGLAGQWRRAETLLVLLLAAYLLVLASGPQSMARFRVPCDPLLAPFVAHGLWRLWSRRRGTQSAGGGSDG